jgi:hypothetical protein
MRFVTFGRDNYIYKFNKGAVSKGESRGRRRKGKE